MGEPLAPSLIRLLPLGIHWPKLSLGNFSACHCKVHKTSSTEPIPEDWITGKIVKLLLPSRSATVALHPTDFKTTPCYD